MIGPSSGTGSSDGAGAKRHHHHHRLLLDELDIEGICDEVCGHHHHHASGQPTSKRPRYATELAASMLIEHDALGLDLRPEAIYAPYFDQPQQQMQMMQQPQMQQQQGSDAPIAKLEVLVVDGTWDDALEGFDAAGVTTSQQSCSSLLTELTSEHNLPQHHHEIPASLVDYQNAYWSQQSPEQHQQQQQIHPIQPQQQQQTMPKVQHCADIGRQRNALAPGTFGIPNYEDQENGNLSWLLDFKLDSFIEAPEDKSAGLQPRDFHGIRSKFNGSNSSNSASSISSLGGSAANRPTVSQDSGRKSCAGQESTRCDGSHSPDSRKCAPGPKKPPFTYTELIEHALQERGELTVSAIYQWISEHFPYYKSNDDRWKNSVRHNLSINPHFRKGSKAPHGAGHLWAIASQDESKPRQLFNIASIRQALRNEEANAARASNSQAEAIDEVAAATASIAQPADEEEDESDIADTISLEHCAEQILSGIKKEVEVQYLVPMMVAANGPESAGHSAQACQSAGAVEPAGPLCDIKETDFLNPVSKEVVAEECGLLGEGYLVTDLNPASLGLNMAEHEVVSADNLFGEELSFQFYEFAAASSQLQSA